MKKFILATVALICLASIAGAVIYSAQVVPAGKTWRFISVPFVLDNSSVDSALAGIDYTALFEFDNQKKIFISPVTDLQPLHGYIIFMNSNQQMPSLTRKKGPVLPPSMAVYRGWNLIGTPGNVSLDASTMLGSIDTSYFSIWDWNVPMQNYDEIGINGKTGLITPPPPITIEGTDVFSMHPKVSYWVWATHNDTLVAFSP